MELKNRLKTGPKRTKPNRSTDCIRIDITSLDRMNTLLEIRNKNNPKPRVSKSDIVNEALEMFLDAEGIQHTPQTSNRRGVEL